MRFLISEVPLYTATSQPPLFSGFGPKLFLTKEIRQKSRIPPGNPNLSRKFEHLSEMQGVKAREWRDASRQTLRV